MPGINVVLYADDLVILSLGKCMEKLEENLNLALKTLHKWSKENEAEVNFEKTKYQIFSMTNSTETPKLKNEIFDLLETTNQVYLGIHLDRRLTFKDHANQQAKNAENSH